MTRAQANKYCRATDLTNEASVEAFFVNRLLADLGYRDNEIKTKRAIQELRIPRGRQSERYRPDYLLMAGSSPRWLIDAKATGEKIEDFTHQCAGYALQINRKYTERPVRYYMLTNGLLTRVYVWDQEEAILSLRFGDFAVGKAKFQTLRKLLGADVVRVGWPVQSASTATTKNCHPSTQTSKHGRGEESVFTLSSHYLEGRKAQPTSGLRGVCKASVREALGRPATTGHTRAHGNDRERRTSSSNRCEILNTVDQRARDEQSEPS